MTTVYVAEQRALLNVLDVLSKEDVAGARQGATLDENVAAADGDDHAVKKVGMSHADDGLLSTCGMEIISLFVTGVPSILDHNCTRASLAKHAQSIPESLMDVHCGAMEAVKKVERHHEPAVVIWRGD